MTMKNSSFVQEIVSITLSKMFGRIIKNAAETCWRQVFCFASPVVVLELQCFQAPRDLHFPSLRVTLPLSINMLPPPTKVFPLLTCYPHPPIDVTPL